MKLHDEPVERDDPVFWAVMSDSYTNGHVVSVGEGRFSVVFDGMPDHIYSFNASGKCVGRPTAMFAKTANIKLQWWNIHHQMTPTKGGGVLAKSTLRFDNDVS